MVSSLLKGALNLFSVVKINSCNPEENSGILLNFTTTSSTLSDSIVNSTLTHPGNVAGLVTSKVGGIEVVATGASIDDGAGVGLDVSPQPE